MALCLSVNESFMKPETGSVYPVQTGCHGDVCWLLLYVCTPR